jgi:hypothetical protein
VGHIAFLGGMKIACKPLVVKPERKNDLAERFTDGRIILK